MGLGSGTGAVLGRRGGTVPSHSSPLPAAVAPPTPSPRCRCPGSPTLGVPSWLRGRLKAKRGDVPRGCGSPDPVCLTGGASGQPPLLTVAKCSAGRSQDPPGSLSRALGLTPSVRAAAAPRAGREVASCFILTTPEVSLPPSAPHRAAAPSPAAPSGCPLPGPEGAESPLPAPRWRGPAPRVLPGSAKGERGHRGGSRAMRAASAGAVVPPPCPPPLTQRGGSRARGQPAARPAAGEPALEIGYLLLSLDPHVLHPLLYVLAFVGAALLALLQPGRRVHHLHGRDGNATALSGQRISGGGD